MMSFLVEVSDVDEDCDQEVLRDAIAAALIVAFPYLDTEVSCAEI